MEGEMTGEALAWAEVQIAAAIPDTGVGEPVEIGFAGNHVYGVGIGVGDGHAEGESLANPRPLALEVAVSTGDANGEGL